MDSGINFADEHFRHEQTIYISFQTAVNWESGMKRKNQD